MLQLFAMVCLTSFLIFKGSPELKDGDEEMKQTLARLERRLEELASVKAPLDEDKPQLRPIRTMAERTAGDSCEAPHTCYGGSAV